MKRAFSAPLSAWIAFGILNVFNGIPTFTKALETTNQTLGGELMGIAIGQMLSGIVGCWLCWAAGKGAWLGFRGLALRLRRA